MVLPMAFGIIKLSQKTYILVPSVKYRSVIVLR